MPQLCKRHMMLSTPVADVPALLVMEAQRTSFSGTILVLHRFGETKESHHELYYREQALLAQAGFLLVNIDAPHHGERKDEILDQLIPQEPEHAYLYFCYLSEMIQEIPFILDNLRSWQQGHLGILGHSMGGFIALGALTHDPRIKAVVTVVGSPVWVPRFACDLPEMEELKKHSPAAMPEKFFPCPVFMANASLDRTVPIAPVRTFAQAIRPYYAPDPQRFCYVEYPDCGHALNERAWEDFLPRAVAWFARYLASD